MGESPASDRRCEESRGNHVNTRVKKPSGDTPDTRLLRIESKLTRLMLGLGMDTEGNPASGSLVMDKGLTDRVIDTLDLYLDLLNKQEDTSEYRTDYNEGERLYNQLIDIRNARWDHRPCRKN